MGRDGGPERPSLAKAAANRANAARPRIASRRSSADSETALTQCVELLRLGSVDAVELLRRLVMDRLYVVRNGQRVRVRVSPGVRLRAATELLDRAGAVKRSEAALLVATSPPKLFVLDGSKFTPPPSWSEPPALPATGSDGACAAKGLGPGLLEGTSESVTETETGSEAPVEPKPALPIASEVEEPEPFSSDA